MEKIKLFDVDLEHTSSNREFMSQMSVWIILDAIAAPRVHSGDAQANFIFQRSLQRKGVAIQGKVIGFIPGNGFEGAWIVQLFTGEYIPCWTFELLKLFSDIKS